MVLLPAVILGYMFFFVFVKTDLKFGSLLMGLEPLCIHFPNHISELY